MDNFSHFSLMSTGMSDVKVEVEVKGFYQRIRLKRPVDCRRRRKENKSQKKRGKKKNNAQGCKASARIYTRAFPSPSLLLFLERPLTASVISRQCITCLFETAQQPFHQEIDIPFWIKDFSALNYRVITILFYAIACLSHECHVSKGLRAVFQLILKICI